MGKTVSQPAVAIFDLDGTLTSRNSFIPYLLSFGRRHCKYTALSMVPFQIGPYLIRLVKDHQLKQRLLRSFFYGVHRDIITQHTRWFCSTWLPNHLHTLGHGLLREHLEQNHRVILLSASPDIYVREMAAQFGIGEAVCTQVEFQDDICTGRLLGANCKGTNKLIALKNYLGCEEPQTESFAYGDSRQDLPVLKWVSHGILVKSRRTIPLSADFPSVTSSQRP